MPNTIALRARRSLLTAFAVGSLLLAAGCTAHVSPAPYGYTTVTGATVPVDIYSRPYVYYDGRPTYWVDGRWYYTAPGGGWNYYRQVPPALDRQRPYVQQAPPAYRQAPPAYRTYPSPYGGPRSAPPVQSPGYAPRSAPPAVPVQPPPAVRVR